MRSTRTAVYRCYGASEQLLYIGATAQPKVRLKLHESKRPEWPQVERVDWEWHETRAEALAAESAAIATELPAWNLRDIPGWRQTHTRRKPGKYVTVRDAAERLSAGDATIRRLFDDGELDGYRTERGKHRRILRASLDEFLAKRAGGKG